MSSSEQQQANIHSTPQHCQHSQNESAEQHQANVHTQQQCQQQHQADVHTEHLHNSQHHDFCPTSNDRGTTMAYFNACMKPSGVVLALSTEGRRNILQQYFTQHVVDAYMTTSPETGEILIPHNELLEALIKSPQLVLEETPIHQYMTLLRGSYTSIIQEAARKLATHWIVRKYFFQDRAFLPMVQSSKQTGVKGALSEEDMEWLERGFITILPSTVDPIKKRSVTTMNPQNLPSYHSSAAQYEKIKIRISFYFLHLVSMNPVTQQEGAICINVLSKKPSQYCAQWSYYLVEEVFPIKDFVVHYLLLPSRVIRTQTFMSFAISVSQYIIAIMSSFLVGAKFYFGYTDKSVLQKLAESTGLSINEIKFWIWGFDSWCVEKFQMWQRQQLQIEWEHQLQTSNSKEEADEERSRRSNAGRCRRKREKRRQKFEDLEKEADDLKHQNESLKIDNARLEQLLVYAQAEAHVLEDFEHGKIHCSKMRLSNTD